MVAKLINVGRNDSYVQIARQLGYKHDVIELIRHADDEMAISRILHDARLSY